MNQNISKNLIRIRKEKGLAAKSVAKLLDVDEKVYISWEMGIAQPSVDEIIKISDTYNIDYSELFVQSNETSVNTSTSAKTTKEKSSQKQASFSLGWSITNMVMIFVFCLTLITPLVYVGGGRHEICFWDFFALENAWVIVPILFLLISLYFVVDAIIKMSSRNIAEGMYGKVSNIVKLPLCAVLAACFIAASCGLGRNIDWPIIFPAIALALTIIFTIVECVLALKKKERKQKN